MDIGEVQRLRVDIYQLADDHLFQSCRRDGAGWAWGWADLQRDWMNATPFRHAYRCLPLTIINQTGWWVKNPVGFTALWDGTSSPGSIQFRFDSPDAVWPQWINSQFGEGIITWNTPFLFRTKPVGSRLLITGPANYFRKNLHPLTALIESDWMTMSFTMNYKVMTPHEAVRFEVGEPLFQVIPLVSNVCDDLEDAEVRYQRLTDDPEVSQAYLDWSTARTEFHRSKARREVRGDQWQKDYFQGRDATGRAAAPEHKTKVKPPQIYYGPVAGPAVATAEGATSIPPAWVRADPGVAPADPPTRRRHRPAPRRGGFGAPELGATTASQAARAGKSGAIEVAQGDGRLAGCPMGYGGGLAAGRPGRTDGMGPIVGEQEVPMQRLSKLRKKMPRALAPNSQRTGAARPTHRVDPGVTPPRVDDNHRRWIAENLLLESPPERIHEAMIQLGLDGEEAAAEINLALQSPYLMGADRLRNRLKKRNWLLATYRKIQRLHPEAQAIPRKHRLSRDQFLAEHYSTNRPVIITGMMDDWPALRKWNLDFFAANFGDREIEVQLGRNSGANYEVEREKYLRRIGFGRFIEMVRNAGRTNDFYLTANNNSSNKSILPELWDDVVQVSEYLDGSDPMAGFFWMGPRGTVTPFHHDLTNNFMAQVIGRKLIKIVPSWDMPLMRNERHVFSEVDGTGLPAQPNPDHHVPQVVECILEPGELLFLPIGCLHYVEGLDITVTVSFTNFRFDNDFSSFYSTYHQV